LPFYISAYTTLNELLAVFFMYNDINKPTHQETTNIGLSLCFYM